jgi:hypothetical protein
MILTLIIKRGIGIRILKYDSDFELKSGPLQAQGLGASEKKKNNKKYYIITNNWGLFGKKNYLTYDWWKHFLKILRRSEVTINLIRRLKKMGASEFAPL